MSEYDDRDDAASDVPGAEPGTRDGDDRLAVRREFARTLSQNGFPDTLVLSRDRAGVVFHERRLEIVDYLRAHEPPSVRALANALGYDKALVSRDLQKLAQIDVVEYVADGRAKAPRLKHAHVAIEPVV